MKINSIIYAFLALFFFSLSSCVSDYDDWLYLHVENKSEILICVFIYETESDFVSDYPSEMILKPNSSQDRMYQKKDYKFKQNSGVKIIVIKLNDCEHYDKAKLENSIIENNHEIDAIIKYYSVDELRAMNWTIVYDGNLH